MLIILPVVTVAELAVNEAPSEWNEGECVETRKARLSSRASSAALASDYHNGRGTRDDRGPRRRERICSQSQWEKEWERQKDSLVGDISKGNRRTPCANCEDESRR